MPRPSKEIKSDKEIKLSAAKKVANTLAITNRRIRVADLLIQRYTMREISTQLEVALSTIVLDKRAIDAELAEVYTEEYQWRRERELERLDMLERDIMSKITFAIDTEDELKWTNMQLRVMSMRAKWLGYDTSFKPATNEPTFQDNRAVTNVYIGNSGDSSAKPFVQELREKLMPQLTKGVST